MKISVHIEEWELTQPFRISNFEWINSRGIVVQLAEGGYIGRGEAQGVFYLNESAESIFAQVHEVAAQIRRGISREDLQELLPAGGARNAIDCAMWDLECKKSGKSIWQLTGIDPKPVTSVFTIGLEDTSGTRWPCLPDVTYSTSPVCFRYMDFTLSTGSALITRVSPARES